MSMFPRYDAGVKLGGFPYPMPTKTILALAAEVLEIVGPVRNGFHRFVEGVAPGPVSKVKAAAAAAQHPLSKGLPLMDPVDVALCIVLYFVGILICLVIGKVVGKLRMRGFVIVYNLFLILLSMWMAAGFAMDAYADFGLRMWNNDVSSGPFSVSIRNTMWIFYASKLVEYMDTYIMLLKQNYEQFSFLHVYHHSTIVLIAFMFMLIGPGGDAFWSGMVNSSIHVLMYTYYLLSFVFREGRVKKFLQSKKLFLTTAQITQFVFNVVQTVYVLFFTANPKYSRFLMWMNMFYMLTLIILFINFVLMQRKKKRLQRQKEMESKHK